MKCLVHVKCINGEAFEKHLDFTYESLYGLNLHGLVNPNTIKEITVKMLSDGAAIETDATAAKIQSPSR